MNRLIIVIAVTVAMLAGCSQGQSGGGPRAAINTDKDKVSYMSGHELGSNLKERYNEVGIDALLQGIRDGFEGKQAVISNEDLEKALEGYKKERESAMIALAEKNKKEGEEFLSANKTKEGVKSTESGLQYKVITEGTGKKPNVDNIVTVHYKGALINGTEFDSSTDGEPIAIPIANTIKGMQEALSMMKEGAKWQLFIPSELAYGAEPLGNKIGPNSTLVFEIELVKVLSLEDEDKKK